MSAMNRIVNIIMRPGKEWEVSFRETITVGAMAAGGLLLLFVNVPDIHGTRLRNSYACMGIHTALNHLRHKPNIRRPSEGWNPVHRIVKILDGTGWPDMASPSQPTLGRRFFGLNRVA